MKRLKKLMSEDISEKLTENGENDEIRFFIKFFEAENDNKK